MQSHTFTRTRGVIVNGRPRGRGAERGTRSASRRRPDGAGTSSAGILPPTFVLGFHDEEKARKMKYNVLSGTDMTVSRVAFGCGPIGGLFGNVADSITVLIESALKDGINLIDTAYWYGQSRSERILGKVGRFELDFVRSFDFRADKILESLTESLKNLRLTYVDVCFLQIHDVEYKSNERIVLFETLSALEMAKESGRIRYIGVTGYSLDKIARLIETSRVRIDVVMSYAHGTLNDNSLGRFTSFFQKHSIGLLNASPLCMGLLSSEGAPPWHPADHVIREAVQEAVEYCNSKHVSIARLALHYALHFPSTASCVVGIDSIVHLIEAIHLATGQELSETERRIRDRLMRRYLDRLDNRGWGDIDISDYWKRQKMLGLPSLATNRHHSVESISSALNGFSLRGSSSDIRRRSSRTSSVTPRSTI